MEKAFNIQDVRLKLDFSLFGMINKNSSVSEYYLQLVIILWVKILTMSMYTMDFIKIQDNCKSPSLKINTLKSSQHHKG